MQIARRGLKVRLYEMRPTVMTPAHGSGDLGELVCSSSLKSDSPETAHGLLKEEMRQLGSVVLECAEKTRVPGGDALCVDREAFSAAMTERISSQPGVELIRCEVTEIPSGRPCVIATGPLTSPALAQNIQAALGTRKLHFFDAIAPSVDADSIDYSRVFRQSRYDKGGEAAYINCPMSREEYRAFIDALLSAETADLHLEEDRDASYFEGCLPVEVIAARGRDTLAHGAMKPVGLADPRDGRRPYAVVQLRQENAEGSVYGLVGFQTQLKQSEQARVFRLIPGLERARFVRYGSVHRNTYIDSPRVLTTALNARLDSELFFAGQIVGVEGYVESAGSGIVAGINAANAVQSREALTLPRETMLGALLDYVANCPCETFQPMNSNFGILPELAQPHHKRDRKRLKIERARAAMREFVPRV